MAAPLSALSQKLGERLPSGWSCLTRDGRATRTEPYVSVDGGVRRGQAPGNAVEFSDSGHSVPALPVELPAAVHDHVAAVERGVELGVIAARVRSTFDLRTFSSTAAPERGFSGFLL